MTKRRQFWRVGALAELTGLSVRTLHFYEQKGLLPPATRGGNDYRVYTRDDLARLQHIKSLRHLGFSLAQVKDCLHGKQFSPRRVLAMHLKQLRERVGHEMRVIRQLEALTDAFNRSRRVSATMFLQTIKEMQMAENYFTAEQSADIAKRGEALGPEGMKKAEADWTEIIAQLREHKKNGTPATDPAILKLKERSQELIRGFTGGDPGIAKSLGKMWKEEKHIHGFDTGEMRALMAYMHGGTGG